MTHRCHNGRFLLKFARDRDMYRSMMRERLGKYDPKVLGYCITSNHIHAVVTAPNRYGLARFMQSAATVLWKKSKKVSRIDSGERSSRQNRRREHIF